MLSLHRSAQLITTEVKSCEMGIILLFHLGGLDRTLTWLNSYLNIFPCFSISRLEMLPLFLEPKLWEKLQGRFEKKVKVWATWSSLAASLWPMATRELTGVGQLSWRPVPIKHLYLSSKHFPTAINLKGLLLAKTCASKRCFTCADMRQV